MRCVVSDSLNVPTSFLQLDVNGELGVQFPQPFDEATLVMTENDHMSRESTQFAKSVTQPPIITAHLAICGHA
jgi:hypothetical protein